VTHSFVAQLGQRLPQIVKKTENVNNISFSFSISSSAILSKMLKMLGEIKCISFFVIDLPHV
jgi:hypothetical protein